jgi:protein-S-isoprenylcysteine O-methyltransferase
MALACLEYWVEQTYFPWIKQPWVTYIGIFLVISGEILRKTGIITARRNFTHRVQLEHRPEHELVTTGIYSYMRHPGYAGWVLWAIGTQVMLCNPICTPLFIYVVRKNYTILYFLCSSQPPLAVTDHEFHPYHSLFLQCLRFMRRRIQIEDQLLRRFFGEEWVKWREGVPSGLPTIP